MAPHPNRSVLCGAKFCLLLGLVSACGSEAGQHQPDVGGVVQRDSAGILIVETPGSAARAPFGWRIGDEPDLQIGSVDSGGPDEFVEIEGNIVGLPDGRIVVLDMGHHELRFFDSEGRFLSSAGGRGEGPGEFQGFPFLFPYPPNDSLLVVDSQLRRFTLFSSDGEGHRVLTRPVMGSVQGVHGSRILFTQGLDPERAARPEGGTNPSPTGVFLGDLDTGEDEIIVQFDWPLYYDPDEPNIALRRLLVPFHTLPSAVWGSGSFYVVGGHWPEVREFDSDGRLIRIMRVAEAPRPVTQQDLDVIISNRSQALPESSLRRVYGRMELPEIWPTFQDVHVDPLGWLWVDFYTPQWYYVDGDVNRWIIFDPDGVARGTIDLPQSFRLVDIGPDYLLGTWWDEQYVQYVRRYRIERSN